jgi:hypothetical protein
VPLHRLPDKIRSWFMEKEAGDDKCLPERDGLLRHWVIMSNCNTAHASRVLEGGVNINPNRRDDGSN